MKFVVFSKIILFLKKFKTEWLFFRFKSNLFSFNSFVIDWERKSKYFVNNSFFWTSFANPNILFHTSPNSSIFVIVWHLKTLSILITLLLAFLLSESSKSSLLLSSFLFSIILFFKLFIFILNIWIIREK